MGTTKETAISRKQGSYKPKREEPTPLPTFMATEKMPPPLHSLGILREEPLQASTRYGEALRRGMVSHMDRVAWITTKPFTREDMNRLEAILEITYPNIRKESDAPPRNKPYLGLKKAKQIFNRRVALTYDNIVIIVDFERDNKWRTADKKQAIVWVSWTLKEDYTNYAGYLRDFEKILAILGGDWQLWYCEIDLDTTSPGLGRALFNHTLVRGCNAKQIMHCTEGTTWYRKGIIPECLNTLHNKQENKRQLANHTMDRDTDYYDTTTKSWIWRSEIRLKKEVINPDGKTKVGQIIANAEMMYNGNVLWKQVRIDRMDGLGFTESENELIKNDSVIYWVWQLVRKKMSMGHIRTDYCSNTTPMKAILQV